MKSVLLTGGSRGIGAAILHRLIAQQNFTVYLVGRTAPELSRQDRQMVKFYEADLCNLERTREAIQSVRADAEHVDVLINNAGIGLFKPIEEIGPEEWMRVLNINLVAPFMFIREFLPQMKKRNFGRVVNISSDADQRGFAGASVYCASKYGLKGMSDAVRLELVGSNVSITTISPGRVDTFFNNKRPGDRPVSLTPDDVASQVLNVISTTERCHIESIYLKSTLE